GEAGQSLLPGLPVEQQGYEGEQHIGGQEISGANGGNKEQRSAQQPHGQHRPPDGGGPPGLGQQEAPHRRQGQPDAQGEIVIPRPPQPVLRRPPQLEQVEGDQDQGGNPPPASPLPYQPHQQNADEQGGRRGEHHRLGHNLPQVLQGQGHV